MTNSDKLNKTYCEAEKAMFQALYDREKWYAGLDLGYDPMTTEEGHMLVEMRMSNVILSSFGALVAEQVKQQKKSQQ